MWPWEHAAVAYLVYSLLVHVARGRRPRGPEAWAVLVASLFPDLLDKPLAWEFGVFGSGYGLAHSVFFAVPVALAVVALSDHYGRGAAGSAFAIGYLVHLPLDVLPKALTDGHLPVERVLWPVRRIETSYDQGFDGTLVSYLRNYPDLLFGGEPSAYTALALGSVAACLALWIADGLPGLREPAAYLHRRFSAGVA